MRAFETFNLLRRQPTGTFTLFLFLDLFFFSFLNLCFLYLILLSTPAVETGKCYCAYKGDQDEYDQQSFHTRRFCTYKLRRFAQYKYYFL